MLMEENWIVFPHRRQFYIYGIGVADILSKSRALAVHTLDESNDVSLRRYDPAVVYGDGDVHFGFNLTWSAGLPRFRIDNINQMQGARQDDGHLALSPYGLSEFQVDMQGL